MIYALVTIVMFFSIRSQAKAAHRQADIADTAAKAAMKGADAATEAADAARQSIILTHRPKLVVRNVVVRTPESPYGSAPTGMFDWSTPLGGQFYVSNVGGSMADIVESHCMAFLRYIRPLPMERPYEGQNPNNPIQPGTKLVPGGYTLGVIPPSGTVELELDQSKSLGAPNEASAKLLSTDVNWMLYFMGWVSYRDDVGNIRTTCFCRAYDRSKGRFTALDDPDYEHAE